MLRGLKVGEIISVLRWGLCFLVLLVDHLPLFIGQWGLVITLGIGQHLLLEDYDGGITIVQLFFGYLGSGYQGIEPCHWRLDVSSPHHVFKSRWR